MVQICWVFPLLLHDFLINGRGICACVEWKASEDMVSVVLAMQSNQ